MLASHGTNGTTVMRTPKRIALRVLAVISRGSSTSGSQPCGPFPPCAAGRPRPPVARRGLVSACTRMPAGRRRCAAARRLIRCTHRPSSAARSPSDGCRSLVGLFLFALGIVLMLESRSRALALGRAHPGGLGAHVAVVRHGERRHRALSCSSSPGRSVRAIGPGTVANAVLIGLIRRRPARDRRRSTSSPSAPLGPASSMMVIGLAGDRDRLGALHRSGDRSRAARLADARRSRIARHAGSASSRAAIEVTVDRRRVRARRHGRDRHARLRARHRPGRRALVLAARAEPARRRGAQPSRTRS